MQAGRVGGEPGIDRRRRSPLGTVSRCAIHGVSLGSGQSPKLDLLSWLGQSQNPRRRCLLEGVLEELTRGDRDDSETLTFRSRNHDEVSRGDWNPPGARPDHGSMALESEAADGFFAHS